MINQVTLMRGALRLCQEGISIVDLKEYIHMRGSNVESVLRIIRRARTYGGFDWNIDERRGRIKITLIRKDEEL